MPDKSRLLVSEARAGENVFARAASERLTWFLFAAVLIFASAAFRNSVRAATKEPPSTGVNRLRQSFRTQWNREPDPAELGTLVADLKSDERLYRTALANGLDQDDAIIRRRLVQKLEFLLQEPASITPPTDAELAVHLAADSDRYREPGRTAFSHIFFSPSRRGAGATGEARQMVAHLNALKHPPDLSPEAGDPFMFGYDFQGQSEAEIASQFGEAFARLVSRQAIGSWQGPIESAFGVHLVRVRSRMDGRLPALAEVRSRVLSDVMSQRERASLDAAFAKIRSHYQIVIQQENR